MHNQKEHCDKFKCIEVTKVTLNFKDIQCLDFACKYLTITVFHAVISILLPP